MCICLVGLNGLFCESFVVENKVNVKCVLLNIILLFMYVCFINLFEFKLFYYFVLY